MKGAVVRGLQGVMESRRPITMDGFSRRRAGL